MHRKTKLLSLLCIFLFTALHMSAQKVEEIVALHIAALGGPGKLDSLKSLLMEGTMRVDAYNLPMTRYIADDKAQRFDFSFMMIKGFVLTTKEKGWNFFPFAGMKEPQPMADQELDNYRLSMDLQGELHRYKEKGYAVQLEGIDTVLNNPCFKLKITLPGNKTLTQYIDQSSYLLVRSTMKGYMDGKEAEIVNQYGNYKKTEGGYVFPHAMTIGPGKAFITRIEVNPQLDEKIFEPKQ